MIAAKEARIKMLKEIKTVFLDYERYCFDIGNCDICSYGKSKSCSDDWMKQELLNDEKFGLYLDTGEKWEQDLNYREQGNFIDFINYKIDEME